MHRRSTTKGEKCLEEVIKVVKYDKYLVRIEFIKPVVGALPKNSGVIEAWIRSRQRRGVDPKYIRELIEKVRKEVGADENASKHYTTFKRDEEGIYIEDRNIKAMLREAANVLEAFKGSGSSARKQTFQHGLFVKPERIRFLRDGEVIREPETTQERAVHVMTPRGPRSTVKLEDVVLPGAQLQFEIWVVVPSSRGGAHIPEAMLRDWIELGQEIGLGGSRSQQFGKYRILEFKKIE